MSLKEEIDIGLLTLKDELYVASKIFDYYKIPDDTQRFIFENGISYDYFGDGVSTFGRRSSNLSGIRFSEILMFCKDNNIEIDINEVLQIVVLSWKSDDDALKYRVWRQLSRIVDQLKESEKLKLQEKTKSKTRAMSLELIRQR